jgi:hypothetical protein
MVAMMRRCGRAAALMVAGLLLVVSTWSGAVAASPTPLPLSARLIRSGDFVGFRPESATQSFTSAKAWAATGPHPTAGQVRADIARLHREGFVAVLSKFLDRGNVRASGLSWVMQLGSAASARAELKADLQAQTSASRGSFSRFSIPAIPGSKGFRVSGGGSGAENFLFADGPFVYLIGQGWSAAEKNPPTHAGLIAAVTKLYKRVHGHPAG